MGNGWLHLIGLSVNTVNQWVHQLTATAGRVAGFTWAMAIRQVILQGIYSALWAAIWIVGLWVVGHYARRVWWPAWVAWKAPADQTAFEWLERERSAMVWTVFWTGSCLLVVFGLIAAIQVATDLQSALFNLGNPDWAALVMLKNLVFHK